MGRNPFVELSDDTTITYSDLKTKVNGKATTVSYQTDSLSGILKDNYDIDSIKEERLRDKYAVNDNGLKGI